MARPVGRRATGTVAAVVPPPGSRTPSRAASEGAYRRAPGSTGRGGGPGAAARPVTGTPSGRSRRGPCRGTGSRPGATSGRQAAASRGMPGRGLSGRRHVPAPPVKRPSPRCPGGSVPPLRPDRRSAPVDRPLRPWGCPAARRRWRRPARRPGSASSPPRRGAHRERHRNRGRAGPPGTRRPPGPVPALRTAGPARRAPPGCGRRPRAAPRRSRRSGEPPTAGPRAPCPPSRRGLARRWSRRTALRRMSGRGSGDASTPNSSSAPNRCPECRPGTAPGRRAAATGRPPGWPWPCRQLFPT